MLRSHVVSLFVFAVVLLAPAAGLRAAEPACPVDLSGKWHGNWKSCETGHHGPLNATFCKINDACYQVRFTGRFFVALPFRFTVNLEVTEEEGGRVFLSGSPRLPLFGTFHFDAVATECEFTATYCSRNDRGRFTLCR
jgi:hypothetical protein